MKRINVEMNLTMRCQLRCTNCNRLPQLFPDRGEEEDMTARQVLRFCNQVANSPVKVKRLKLLGGEPLLVPHFSEVYDHLLAAVGEGLISRIKIESNYVLPKPDLPEHPQIRWAGKPQHRKRHLPVLWSPRDLGYKTKGPCSMPRICGPSLDAYGYALCSVAVMMFRIFGREDLYRKEFPGDWRRDFAEAIETICPDCCWSMPQDWCEAHSYPLAETPEAAKQPTETWRYHLDRWDQKVKKERW